MIDADRWKFVMRRLEPYRGLLALAVVFVLCILFSLNKMTRDGVPTFLTLNNQANVLRDMSEVGILAVGMTLVIITAGIDLSVGSVLAMCSMVFAAFLMQMSAPTFPSMLLGLLTGALSGLVCGFLITFFRIQPFVATLAMMVSARGVAKWVNHGEKIFLILPGEAQSTPVDWLDTRVLGDKVAVVSIIFIGTLFFFHFVLAHTPFGRSLYAIGGNEEAARLSGIRVRITKTSTYMICGFLAGLCGILHAAQATQGDPDAGIMYELDAIAAVVIGGTSLMGGRGGMLQTLVGVLIIGYIKNILRINNVSDEVRQVIQGAIIIAAVLIQQRRRQ